MKKMLLILAILAGLAILGCSQKPTETSASMTCEYSKIEVYYYYSPYCPHCKNVSPYVEELKEKYRDVKFYFCNVSDKNIPKECYTYAYYVMGTPTVVVHADNVTTALIGERDVMGLEKVIRGLACCEK